MGWFDPDPVKEDWQRDQIERGGTRAASTFQQENMGSSDVSERWIRERAVDAGWERRSGEDRRE